MPHVNSEEMEKNKKKKKKKSRNLHKNNDIRKSIKEKNRKEEQNKELEQGQSYGEQIEEILALNHIYFPIYVENAGHVRKSHLPPDLMTTETFLKKSKELSHLVMIDMNDEINSSSCLQFCIFFNFDNDFPKYKVTFFCDSKYPFSYPNIGIYLNNALSEQQRNFITLSIKKICAKNYGRITLFDVCMFLNEHINKTANEEFKNLWEEMKHRQDDSNKVSMSRCKEEEHREIDDGGEYLHGDSHGGAFSTEWIRGEQEGKEERENKAHRAKKTKKEKKTHKTNKERNKNEDDNKGEEDDEDNDEDYDENGGKNGGEKYLLSICNVGNISGFASLNSCVLSENCKVKRKKKKEKKRNDKIILEEELNNRNILPISEKKRMIRCEYNNIKNFDIIKKISLSYYKNKLIARHVIDTNMYVIHTYAILNTFHFLTFFLSHILFCNRGFSLFCNISDEKNDRGIKKSQKKEKMFKEFLNDINMNNVTTSNSYNKKKKKKIYDYTSVNYFCSEYQFYANKKCIMNRNNEKTLYDIFKELTLFRLRKVIHHYKMMQKVILKKIIRELVKLSKIQHKYLVRYHLTWSEKECFLLNEEVAEGMHISKMVQLMHWLVRTRVRGEDGNGRSDDDDNDDDNEDDNEDDNGRGGKETLLDLKSSMSKCSKLERRKNGSVRHQEEVKYVESVLKRRRRKHNVLYVQCEYCKGQLLEKEIDSNFFQNNKYLVWQIFRQILEAVSYLHKQKIYIKTLNTQNMYIDNDEYGVHIKIVNYSVANAIDYVYFYHYAYSKHATLFADVVKEFYESGEGVAEEEVKKGEDNEKKREDNVKERDEKRCVDFIRRMKGLAIGNENETCDNYVGQNVNCNRGKSKGGEDFYVHSYNQFFYSTLGKKKHDYEEQDLFSLGLVLYELLHSPFKTKEEKFRNIKNMIAKRAFSENFLRNVDNDALKVLKHILMSTINYESNEHVGRLQYPDMRSVSMKTSEETTKEGDADVKSKKEDAKMALKRDLSSQKGDSPKGSVLIGSSPKGCNPKGSSPKGSSLKGSNPNYDDVYNVKREHGSQRCRRGGTISGTDNSMDVSNESRGNKHSSTTISEESGRVQKITAEQLLNSPLIPMVIQRDLFRYFLQKLKNNSPNECTNILNALLYKSVSEGGMPFEINKNTQSYTNTCTYELDVISSYIYQYFYEVLSKKYCSYNQPLIFQPYIRKSNFHCGHTVDANFMETLPTKLGKNIYVQKKKVGRENNTRVYHSNYQSIKIKRKVFNESLDVISKSVILKKKSEKGVKYSLDPPFRKNQPLKLRNFKRNHEHRRVEESGNDKVDKEGEGRGDIFVIGETKHLKEFTTSLSSKNAFIETENKIEKKGDCSILSRFNERVILIDKNNKLLYLPFYLTEGYVNMIPHLTSGSKNFASSFSFFQNHFTENNKQKIIRRENSILYSTAITVDGSGSSGIIRGVRGNDEVNTAFCIYQLIIVHSVLDMFHHFVPYLKNLIVRWSHTDFVLNVIRDMLSLDCEEKTHYIYHRLREGNMSYKNLKKLLYFLDVNYDEQVLKIFHSLTCVGGDDKEGDHGKSGSGCGRDKLAREMQKVREMYELKNHQNRSYMNRLIDNILYLDILFHHFNSSKYLFEWEYFTNKYKQMFDFSFVFNISSEIKPQNVLSFGGVSANVLSNGDPSQDKDTYNITFEVFVDSIARIILQEVRASPYDDMPIDFHSPSVVITTKAYKLLVYAFSLYNHLVQNNIKCDCKIAPLVETSKFEQALLKYRNINIHVQISQKMNSSSSLYIEEYEGSTENITSTVLGEENVNILYSTHIIRMNIKKNFEHEASLINYIKQFYARR
ncbi:protein kinase, putative [Plasmodium ovale]|uniref:non-specific serine/threonine protein kinase n=1 Tax=Plasmodium ovale TaxID=36330 RepID=A0A1D3TMG1_PLAOA|nr:protein kinase, putative [Plasmodium ovale]